MSTARERHQKRRQQRTEMASRATGNRQVEQPDGFKLPQIKLPFGRWLLLIPLAIFLVIAVVVVLGLINPPDVTTAPNAIWVNLDTSYSNPSDETLQAFATQLRQHQIGTVYVFVSSLKGDNTWSGDPQASNRIQDIQAVVTTYAQRLKIAYPEAKILAWIEVLADSPQYRLDSPQVQAQVADLSATAVNSMGFDGIFLDVKPIFDGNEDLLALLRKVRATVGLDTTIAVSVSPDLTPTDTDLNLPTFIAPNTVWSSQYKQRVSLQADQMVVTAYNSYLTDQIDYIKWVSYQVRAFTEALSGIDTLCQVIVSVPNYTSPSATVPVAHNPIVESMAGALDGVNRALTTLNLAQYNRLQGVAIYTDVVLSEADWAVFNDKWVSVPKNPPKN